MTIKNNSWNAQFTLKFILNKSKEENLKSWVWRWGDLMIVDERKKGGIFSFNYEDEGGG